MAEGRLVEELGQRLAAIGLAVRALKQTGASEKPLKTIGLALDEARHELKLPRSGADRSGGPRLSIFRIEARPGP